MAAISLSLVAKKAIAAFASNKKGRKFIGYVIGIALFLILLPLIIVLGLFGWMSGDGNDVNLDVPQDNIEQFTSIYTEQLIQIEKTFKDSGISENNLKKADYIFLYHLTERYEEKDFCKNYADCFINSSDKKSVYALITEKFGVTFTEEDIKNLDELYGKTAPGGK